MSLYQNPDRPRSYTMGYDIIDGNKDMHGRREVGDSAGNKYGSYSIRLADGRRRLVRYVADERGFRAVVSSNEPGTDHTQDPADVVRTPYPPPPAAVLPPVPPAVVPPLLPPHNTADDDDNRMTTTPGDPQDDDAAIVVLYTDTDRYNYNR